jgi:putative ABC transport system ATP-binding protein
MSVAVATRTPALSCQGVELAHGNGETRVQALSGIDLEIAEGDHVALVGRSGSGKTTLLHVLGGLAVPDRGVIRWRDAVLSELDAAARARIRAHGIAFVFQGANLLTHLSVWENIAFAVRVSGAREDPAIPLALVGLADKAEALPGELSGGERQRVALARAIAQGPDLLLCDEPTGHLDSDTGERVLDLIDALRAQLGLTLVIASHDPSVAARADRAYELAEGRMVGEG